MTKPAPTNSGPDLIVLGLDDNGKPVAARFPATQGDLASKAAALMQLTVCKADGPALSELAAKLPAGRLYASGRGFVPNVRRDLYDKLLQAAGLAGSPPAVAPTGPSGEPALSPLPASGLPDSWDDIQVGHMVLARDEPGWFEAIVVAKDGAQLTLKWRDYPKQAAAVRHAAAVALFKPTPVTG